MHMRSQHEHKMEEAVAAWGVAKGAAEKRFVDGRDVAAGAWLAALQQAQTGAAEQLLSAQQRWSEVRAPQTVLPPCSIAPWRLGRSAWHTTAVCVDVLDRGAVICAQSWVSCICNCTVSAWHLACPAVQRCSKHSCLLHPARQPREEVLPSVGPQFLLWGISAAQPGLRIEGA